MIRSYNPLTPSASLSNISAVVALESYRIPNPQFDVAHAAEAGRLADQFGRALTGEEQATITYSLMVDEGMPYSLGSGWGLTVCNNPHAKILFQDDLFCGPLDERWEMAPDGLMQTFQGEQRASSNVGSTGGSDGEE